MSCAIRIDGYELDVDALIQRISVAPASSYKKGDPRNPFKHERGTFPKSGVNFLVSEADFNEFDQQKKDAIEFLSTHQHWLREILNWPGVSGELDFGISRRDVAIQCDRFPPELLILAGSLGLEIALSQYPSPD